MSHQEFWAVHPLSAGNHPSLVEADLEIPIILANRDQPMILKRIKRR
jgi:hypothetical protein